MTTSLAGQEREGMTLIELIMAIAMAAIVIAIASSIFVTVRTAVSGQSSRGERRVMLSTSLQQVADDIARATRLTPSKDCSFELTKPGAGETFSALSFCGVHSEAARQEVDLRWFDHHRITYRTSGTGPERTLERIYQPLVGPGSLEGATTNVIARQVQSFVVSVYDGASWQTTWPTDEEETMPRAARIELATGEGSRAENMVTEILIAGGTIYTSSVLRSASGY